MSLIGTRACSPAPWAAERLPVANQRSWRAAGPPAHLPLGEGAVHVALHVAALDGLALVADVLAAGDGDLRLGAAVGEVDAGGDEREPLLPDPALEPLDLRLVEQELARALRLVVVAVGVRVRRDVHV